MTIGVGSRFLPDRLPAVSDRGHAWLRPLWLMVLMLTLLLDIAGTVFVLRDSFVNDVTFGRIGLATQFEDDGTVTVYSQEGDDGRAAEVPVGTRIRSIDGTPVAPGTRVWNLVPRLERPDGARVRLELELPNGSRVERDFTASSRIHWELGPASVVSREVRIGFRLALSLATCLTLIACAVLLYLRRSRDPVALLLSFAFLIFAGVIDPPVNLWMAAGTGWLYDAYSDAGWVLLVIALATFPDGRFSPRSLRWLLLVAPVVAVTLSIEGIPMWLNALIAFIAPLGLIGAQAMKYRRFGPGIERQQLKWAAFGFASGLLLLAATFLILPLYSVASPFAPLWSMVVVLLFDLGFISMAIGLLVSLIRFRLWEADRVISKSAVSAAVTVAVGVLWTMSMDLVKNGVEFSLGEENVVVSTLVGAVLAAGIFAPTQTLAQRWANSRLGNDRDRIAALVPKLVAWRATERPDEIGQRTLATLAATAHISSGAILIDTPRGRSLLAARDVGDPDALAEPGANPEGDGRFAVRLPLEDEDGPVGMLLLGPRNDYNRYNSDELEGLRAITEPLAESLRGAQRRLREVDTMQQMLSTVEQRLARLEGGGGTEPGLA